MKRYFPSPHKTEEREFFPLSLLILLLFFLYQIKVFCKRILDGYINRRMINHPNRETLNNYLDRLYWYCGDRIFDIVKEGIEEKVINY